MVPSSNKNHCEPTPTTSIVGNIVRCAGSGKLGLAIGIKGQMVRLAQSNGWGIIDEMECEGTHTAPFIVPKGTRAYAVVDKQFSARGNIGESAVDRSGATTYRLEMPNGTRIVRESELLVRGEADANAGRLLATGFWSEARIFLRRIAFLESFIKQLSAGGGVESFLASEYIPYPHQIAAVERIVRERRPRFLLADEVGLGKTYEAGMAVRELLRRGPGKALVLAPAILLDQWRHELVDRLGIDPARLDFADLNEDIPSGCHTIVAIDEVHTIANDQRGMERARRVCGGASAVLLISATAAFDNVEMFLPLMNLIQPGLYPLDDWAGFKARIGRQTEISELLATFLPDISRRSIRNHLARIDALLADDEAVRAEVARLEEIISDDDYDQGEANRAVAALRGRIVEGERVARHVIRASRRLVELAFRYGRKPDRPILRMKLPLPVEVLEALDAWRSTVDCEATLASLFCASALPESLGAASSARLASGTVTTRERPALEAVGELARRAEGLGSVASEIAGSLGAGEAAVVFGSDPSVLADLGRRLRQHGLSAAALLGTEEKAAQRRAVLEFERNRRNPGTRRFVLLCDVAGQEGLNLQGADVLALLDLPWDVVALEQRLGRVDRLGRSRPLRIMVVEHGEEGSVHDAWLEVLERGFGLFERSVSDVQPVLAGLTDRFAKAALSGEVNGPEAYQAAVAEERRRGDVRRALDGDEGREAEIARRSELLADAQTNASRFVEALLAYGAEHGVVARASSRGDVRLDILPDALIPQPWRAQLAAAAGDAWTGAPRDGLPRLGFVHPMSGELKRFALWDDEGQASASWRCLPGLPRSEEALFVKLRFLVGEDHLEIRLVQIDGDGAKGSVRAQARREVEARDTSLAWAHKGLFERFVGIDRLESLVLRALRVATASVERSASGEGVRCVAAELVAVSGKEPVRVS